MAAQVGIEPTTKWLTATCSTAELLSNSFLNFLDSLIFVNSFVIEKCLFLRFAFQLKPLGIRECENLLFFYG